LFLGWLAQFTRAEAAAGMANGTANAARMSRIIRGAP
jgi:hypothetical protein